jgi:hypothetical protein
MAKYYFHSSNGHTCLDDVRGELADLDSVRKEAFCASRELLMLGYVGTDEFGRANRGGCGSQTSPMPRDEQFLPWNFVPRALEMAAYRVRLLIKREPRKQAPQGAAE